MIMPYASNTNKFTDKINDLKWHSNSGCILTSSASFGFTTNLPTNGIHYNKVIIQTNNRVQTNDATVYID